MAVSERPTAWSEDITQLLGGHLDALPDCARAELEQIASKGGARGSLARVALEISARFARVPSGGGPADDEICSLALQSGAAVATVDGALADTLKSLRVRVVRLRGGRVALE